MKSRFLLGPLAAAIASSSAFGQSVFINEIHYDNVGTDAGEFVEIAAPASTDFTGWRLVGYNGSNGTEYFTVELTGQSIDLGAGYGVIVVERPENGLQNGAPDGLALVDSVGNVVQFLSYEGAFTATEGPAQGIDSTDIGVAESGDTAIGASLQLTGQGFSYGDFTWSAVGQDTRGLANTGQVFDSADTGGNDDGNDDGDNQSDKSVLITEIHYDNAGGDTGEAVEITGPAGTSADGWTVVFYNGNGGGEYKTVPLTGNFSDFGDGRGAVRLDVTGIQNGSPDGLALIAPDGSVTEFLSYEGAFVATDGPAVGISSIDIGVAESSSTPIGESLQRCATEWVGPKPNTFGSPNVCGEQPPEPPVIKDVLISEVQGSGVESPLKGQSVRVTGVVTGDLLDGSELGGFFMQEESVDQDADPSTSEGIFVFCGSTACGAVSVGNRVVVEGNVDEFFGLTQIDNDNDDLKVTILDNGDLLAEITPAVISYPLADDFNLESIESMSVQVSSDMRVVEYFNFDRFGELLLWTDGTGATRPYQPTQVMDPAVVDVQAIDAEFAKQTLLVDDSRNDQNVGKVFPTNADGNSVFGDASYAPDALDGYAGFRGGDLVTDIEGVMGYAFGEYRLYISDPSAGTAIDGQPLGIRVSNTNPRELAPEPVGGTLKVASMNVLNYFTTLDIAPDSCGPDQDLECRGADNADELARQQSKIVQALMGLDADVIALIEVENTAGVSAETTLAEALSAVSTRQYSTVQVEGGVIGSDAIKVALIYDTDTVEPVGPAAVLDADGFVDPLNLGTPKNRAALAQTFRQRSGLGVFTAVVNHLKSKGSSCGEGDDDPVQGNCNGTRLAAAQQLLAWLAEDPTNSGDADVLILGDLNSYAKEDPITAITGAGYTDLGTYFYGDDAYGYLFDGRFGTLDYALSSESLTDQVTGVTEWHINADEPDAIDYDDRFNPSAWFAGDAFRSSDHDPVIVGLDLMGYPESKDDCKQGNWRLLFTREGESFRNQGACVSYAASGKPQPVPGDGNEGKK